jgi:hypothetical protein
MIGISSDTPRIHTGLRGLRGLRGLACGACGACGTCSKPLIDLTGAAITWRRAHEKAAVAVHGPLTDLLLVIYKRRPPRGDGIEVFGDAALLDCWLERVSFG